MGALSYKRAQRVWTESGQIPIYTINKLSSINLQTPIILSVFPAGLSPCIYCRVDHSSILNTPSHYSWPCDV